MHAIELAFAARPPKPVEKPGQDDISQDLARNYNTTPLIEQGSPSHSALGLGSMDGLKGGPGLFEG